MIPINEQFWDDPLRALPYQDYTLSSKDMWAHFLHSHPSSPYYLLPPRDRESIISQDYLKLLTYEFNPDLLLLIEKLNTPRHLSLLASLERRLFEREEFMNTVPYSEKTYQMLDDMMAKTYAMWKNYNDTRKKALEDETQTFGNQEESFLEKGLRI